MKNILLYITIVIFFFAGCTTDVSQDSPSGVKVVSAEGAITIMNVDKSFYTQPVVDHFITNDIGKYLEYDILTDYVVGLTTLKSDPLDDPYTYAYTGIYNQCDRTRAASLSEDVFSVKINDISLTDSKTRANNRADLQSLYGNTIKFNIAKQGAATRAAENEAPATNVDLYVPELIQISAPDIQTEVELYPLCDYKNFVLKWNKDSKNENGVLIIVEWLGTCCFGDSNPNAYIRRMDCVPDTGEITINPDLFTGIPDTAVCYLTVLRGAVENVLAGDYSYKVLGESHEILPFILIREIKAKVQ